jgi:hypothetical protein
VSIAGALGPPADRSPIDVNHAIAALAGEVSVVSAAPLASLLAPRIDQNPPRGAIEQSGVQMTTVAYLQHLGLDEFRQLDPQQLDPGQLAQLERLRPLGQLITAASTRMDRIRDGQRPPDELQTFQIIPENFRADGIIPHMNHGFAQACAVAARNGSIFIMRGVNPSSLGEGGVLTHPERYAPKPMTCHAKSSEFGFTKGLVPANPQFSRPAYANTSGKLYQNACGDVLETLGLDLPLDVVIQNFLKEGVCMRLFREMLREEPAATYKGLLGQLNKLEAMVGTPNAPDATEVTTVRQMLAGYLAEVIKAVSSPKALVSDSEGQALHLKIKIQVEDQNEIQCHVYQGTFRKDDTTYRYQVAIPAGNTDAIQQAIRDRLQDPNHCKVSKDSNWGEGIDLRTLSPPLDTFTSEPTLVIGLKGKPGAQPGTGGSQYPTQDRYYVSDYDVYAIAHTSAATIGQNEQITSWGNHGEFADPRDIKAIIAVNAQLLSQGQDIQNLEEYLSSHFRDFPIQHAPCAATQVTGEGQNMTGYAVPDFPLWVVEPENVIRLDGAGDLAAYMIDLSTKRVRSAKAILNSKVLDHCVNALLNNAA